MATYFVSASHVSPDFTFDRTPVTVSGSAEAFSASHAKLGCGKDRATPEAAIRHLFGDHACTVTAVELAPDFVAMSAEFGEVGRGYDAAAVEAAARALGYSDITMQPAEEPAAAPVKGAFVVYVDSKGAATLCEGGYYAKRYKAAKALNRYAQYAGPSGHYEIRETLDGVACDCVDVLASLDAEAAAVVFAAATQPAPTVFAYVLRRAFGDPNRLTFVVLKYDAATDSRSVEDILQSKPGCEAAIWRSIRKRYAGDHAVNVQVMNHLHGPVIREINMGGAPDYSPRARHARELERAARLRKAADGGTAERRAAYGRSAVRDAREIRELEMRVDRIAAACFAGSPDATRVEIAGRVIVKGPLGGLGRFEDAGSTEPDADGFRDMAELPEDVYQDGADFYHETRGHLWTAPFPVKDSDFAAAVRARGAFLLSLDAKPQGEQSRFVITGQTIDGACAWDGRQWVESVGLAYRFHSQNAANAIADELREANRHRDADSMTGRITVREMPLADLEKTEERYYARAMAEQAADDFDPVARLETAAKAALAFMEGFAGDATQAGLADKIADLRAALGAV